MGAFGLRCQLVGTMSDGADLTPTPLLPRRGARCRSLRDRRGAARTLSCKEAEGWLALKRCASPPKGTQPCAYIAR